MCSAPCTRISQGGVWNPCLGIVPRQGGLGSRRCGWDAVCQGSVQGLHLGLLFIGCCVPAT